MSFKKIEESSMQQLLRNAYKEGNRKALQEYIYSNTPRLNQRFYVLEKKAKTKLSYAYQLAIRETGLEKPRYTHSKRKLQEMTTKELFELSREITFKLESKSTTLRGIIEQEENRIKSSFDKIQGMGYTSIKYNDFKEFLIAGGGKFLNSLDSQQLIEDFDLALKNKGGINEFINALNEYTVNKTTDYIKFKRELKNVLKKKRHDMKHKRNTTGVKLLGKKTCRKRR